MQPTADSPKHDQEYVDPNHLMNKGGVTFIYTISGKLYTQDSGIAHKDMLENDEVWLDVLAYPVGVYNQKLASIPGVGFRRRSLAETSSILGRTGNIEGKNIVSFWGDNKEFLLSHIDKCTNKLLEKGFIHLNTEVHTILFKKTTIEKVLKKDFSDQEENKKEYEINGTIYTWEHLRDLRTKAHTNPDKKNKSFLCGLLSANVIQKYPELRSLVLTNCDGTIIPKTGKLQKYLGSEKVSGWGPVYPMIGDSVLSFKHWLMKEEII